MICYVTPDHNSGCSFTVAFDNALRNTPFTGIEPDMNSAIMEPQIEAGFVRKDDLLPISTPALMHIGPVKSQAAMVLRERNPL
ncbi:hypothetical protein TNCV_374961 [Trichonephila clavipes]|nr:hypothetical protein TNCV_374961 [Trichonephila clavipes]